MSQTRPAFTLVELLVVMAIIGVVSSIVIVNLAGYRAERALRRASQELAAVIREAQNYALTGQSTVMGERVCWHFVRFDSANTYHLHRRVKAVTDIGDQCTGAWPTVASYSLGANVSFSGVPIPGGVAFRLPRAEPLWFSGSWGTFGAPQLITLTRSSISHYLCFYPSGRIEERGTNSSCS